MTNTTYISPIISIVSYFFQHQQHRIAQKAPRNGSVAKKVPKKHGKGKPSTVKMTRILLHLPNNGGRSGSDQSDSAQSDSAQLYCVPKLVTGKLRRGKQMSRLLPTPQINAGRSANQTLHNRTLPNYQTWPNPLQ